MQTKKMSTNSLKSFRIIYLVLYKTIAPIKDATDKYIIICKAWNSQKGYFDIARKIKYGTYILPIWHAVIM